ncbi:MAG TPA: LamG domain-containing protein [bacterium]|nr:LamG domain-containing protein [bacterium]
MITKVMSAIMMCLTFAFFTTIGCDDDDDDNDLDADDDAVDDDFSDDDFIPDDDTGDDDDDTDDDDDDDTVDDDTVDDDTVDDDTVDDDTVDDDTVDDDTVDDDTVDDDTVDDDTVDDDTVDDDTVDDDTADDDTGDDDTVDDDTVDDDTADDDTVDDDTVDDDTADDDTVDDDTVDDDTVDDDTVDDDTVDDDTVDDDTVDDDTVDDDSADDDTADEFALYMDGFDDYACMTNPLAQPVSTDFTIEGWFYFEDDLPPLNEVLFSCLGNGGGFWIFRNHNTQTIWLQYFYTAHILTGYHTTAAIANYEWVHIAVTMNDSEYCLFINGDEDCCRTLSDPMLATYGPLSIGATSSGVDEFEGKIDEVRFSSVVRYSGDFTPATYFVADADTIGLYHYDEGSGSIAYDSSANGNDMTLFGDTAWVPQP